MPCSMEASLGVPQETIVEEEVPTLDPLDPWAQTADAGTAMVFSPEELLEVGIYSGTPCRCGSFFAEPLHFRAEVQVILMS